MAKRAPIDVVLESSKQAEIRLDKARSFEKAYTDRAESLAKQVSDTASNLHRLRSLIQQETKDEADLERRADALEHACSGLLTDVRNVERRALEQQQLAKKAATALKEQDLQAVAKKAVETSLETVQRRMGVSVTEWEEVAVPEPVDSPQADLDRKLLEEVQRLRRRDSEAAEATAELMKQIEAANADIARYEEDLAKLRRNSKPPAAAAVPPHDAVQAELEKHLAEIHQQEQESLANLELIKTRGRAVKEAAMKAEELGVRIEHEMSRCEVCSSHPDEAQHPAPDEPHGTEGSERTQTDSTPLHDVSMADTSSA